MLLQVETTGLSKQSTIRKILCVKTPVTGQEIWIQGMHHQRSDRDWAPAQYHEQERGFSWESHGNLSCNPQKNKRRPFSLRKSDLFLLNSTNPKSVLSRTNNPPPHPSLTARRWWDQSRIIPFQGQQHLPLQSAPFLKHYLALHLLLGGPVQGQYQSQFPYWWRLTPCLLHNAIKASSLLVRNGLHTST